jgi:cytochrome d ubiquinol oxidase subunit I
MLFGWNKVGPGFHFAATLLVALGTTNSAFWILSANSFMQTPQGAGFVDGHLEALDWWAVIFNPSFPFRLAHMLLASLLTASLVVAGVSAYWLRRREHLESARAGLKAGLALLCAAAPLQILAGDQHGLAAREHQPVKVAAIEALWETRSRAPLVLFALPNAAQERNDFELAIPDLASIVLTHDRDGVVQGLKEVPPERRPPVTPVFFAFRVMVGLGFLFLLLGGWGVLRWNRLEQSPLLLRALNYSIPLGFVATIAGWLVAEIGRQPWVVYGLLRTAEAASPVPAPAVGVSLALFVAVYGVLFVTYVYFCTRLVQLGPLPLPRKHPEAIRGARPATVLPPSPRSPLPRAGEG